MRHAAWLAATAAVSAVVRAETVSAPAAPSVPASLASAPLLFKPTDDATLPTTPQWGLAVLLCVFALAIAVVFLRRRGRGLGWRRPSGAFQMVDLHALNANTQLAVVQYRGRQLLLCIGPDGTQCLRDDPLPTEDQS